jgi:hypothetical protein
LVWAWFDRVIHIIRTVHRKLRIASLLLQGVKHRPIKRPLNGRLITKHERLNGRAIARQLAGLEQMRGERNQVGVELNWY